MNLADRLASFERVQLSPDTDSIDTSFADAFLKAFTRVAKSQMKTQQAVELSLEDVRQALHEQADLVEEVKEQRRAVEGTNERLIRFILDVVDLIVGLDRAARDSGNAELRSVADTMMAGLTPRMEEVGLTLIPALGSVPDAVYHFVLSSRETSDAEKKGRVVEVVKPGYTFRGEVVRKADVIVGE